MTTGKVHPAPHRAPGHAAHRQLRNDRTGPMNRVVYVLGAGFSAPLGIPIVRSFLEKSKDLYCADSAACPL